MHLGIKLLTSRYDFGPILSIILLFFNFLTDLLYMKLEIIVVKS